MTENVKLDCLSKLGTSETLASKPLIYTEINKAIALDFLQQSDPLLGQLIGQVGDCQFALSSQQTNLLSVMAWAIISQKLYQLETLPDRKMIELLGEKWKPYRSIASWYLWRSQSDGILGIKL